MERKMNLSFREIMEQDERRVHTEIYKLNIVESTRGILPRGAGGDRRCL